MDSGGLWSFCPLFKKADKGAKNSRESPDLEEPGADRKIAAESDDQNKSDVSPDKIIDRLQANKDLFYHIRTIGESGRLIQGGKRACI